MTNEQILQDVAKLERGLSNPNIPDSAKEKLKAKIETLKSQLKKVEEKVEKKEDKMEKEEKKGQDSLEDTIAKLEKGLNNPNIPASAKEKIKTKIAAAKKELSEQKKEIKEDKKEAETEKKEVKKAVEKLEKVAKRKTPIKREKKEVTEKKVKIKEKVREVKATRRKRKLKVMMTSLEKLISKNKRLKGEYLDSKGKSKVIDLDRDSGRSAKPIGYRFRGEHDYRKPNADQVQKGLKRGTVYKESRPNRGDVFPKGYTGAIKGLKKAKLEEGGMADGGMTDKEKSLIQSRTAKIWDEKYKGSDQETLSDFKRTWKECEEQAIKELKNHSKSKMADGGVMAKGGMSPQKKAANHGASWTIDHKKHNKSQSYEIPLKKRVRK